MSCQTSQNVPILSICKIWVHVMTFCLNVLQRFRQDKSLGQLSLVPVCVCVHPFAPFMHEFQTAV